MNRLYWKIINKALWIRWLILYSYKRILIRKIYISPSFSDAIYWDTFTNSLEWKITDRTDWGSVTKDTIDVVNKDMVLWDYKGVTLKTMRIQKPEVGYYYDGTESEDRYFLGSEIQSQRYFNAENKTGCVFELKPRIGAWYALWLMEHGSNLPGERYREIDIMERFSYNKIRNTSLSISVHSGTNDKRKMFTSTLWLPWLSCKSYQNNIVMECQVTKGIVRIWLNNILCFKYNSKTDWGFMKMRAGASVSTYHGKLDVAKIINDGEMILKYLWEKK